MFSVTCVEMHQNTEQKSLIAILTASTNSVEFLVKKKKLPKRGQLSAHFQTATAF